MLNENSTEPFSILHQSNVRKLHATRLRPMNKRTAIHLIKQCLCDIKGLQSDQSTQVIVVSKQDEQL